jgi:site-specific DNA-methyltransferase (adenine-specific)
MNKLINGDSLIELDKLDENSIGSIVTDPPYELNFMGKGWDNAGISFNTEIWQKCFRVLKPGGHLLAFGGSRTFHRIACAIEDSGFEIRDTIMWLYGSGFPKSLNLGKALDRKNGVDNIQHKGKWNFEHGNMEEFWKRKKDYKKEEEKPLETDLAKQWQGWGTCLKPAFEPIIVARKPFKRKSS